MKFKINFKPYPGAPYFTVQEHQRSFNPKIHNKMDAYLKQAEKHLRSLFNISPDFEFELCELSMKADLMDQMGAVIVKDNPDTGTETPFKSKLDGDPPRVLDLSYSFPQTHYDELKYDYILIDPNASLGVPTGFVIVFSKYKSVKINTLLKDQRNEDLLRDAFLLQNVLYDYVEKDFVLLFRESNYKSAVLYHLIEISPLLKPVADKTIRSNTMILADCSYKTLEQIEMLGFEMEALLYNEKVRIIIANYPTHSKELIEMFSDRIAAL